MLGQIGLLLFLFCAFIANSYATGDVEKRDDPNFSSPFEKLPRQVCSADHAPNNPRLRCSFRGTLSHPKVPIASGRVATFKECRDRCLLNNACVSFGFQAASRQCQHFDNTIRQQKGRRQPNSSWVYNSRNCFDATFYNRQATLNSGFENNGIDPWYAWNYNISLVQPGDSSSNAVFATVRHDSGTFFLLQDNLFLCGSRTYDFSLSYQLAPGGNYSEEPQCDRINPVFLSGGGLQASTNDYLTFLDASTEGTWIHKKAVFSSIPGTGSYGLMIIVQSCGNAGEKKGFGISFDGIKVTARPYKSSRSS